MYNWCLVIVFERKPSQTYNTQWFSGEGTRNTAAAAVVVLTPCSECKKDSSREQINLSKLLHGTRLDEKALDINYYTITHGAEIIWDFDDYNMLKFWIPGAVPPETPSVDTTIPSSETVLKRARA